MRGRQFNSDRRRLLVRAAAGGALLIMRPAIGQDLAEVPLEPKRSATPSGRPKRIVICADGTWNEPERVDAELGRPLPTNVLKVARAVLPRGTDGIDQVVYYHYGVGTGGGLDEVTGGAFGHGIELDVRQLYRFLVYNYEPGDEIYFFGFSRGAFTVRTLAGFLKRVGLLQKDDEYYTKDIFGLYASSTATDSEEWRQAFKNIRERRLCPPIKFLGVWDTVGALGAPGLLGQVFNRDKYKYHDVGLFPEIQNAIHALAIDERRKPFSPTLWKRPEDWRGRLEQVWFPGVHSNVGGSYSPDGLANEALHWMVERAEELGLQFDSRYLAFFRPCFNSRLNDSMSFMYSVMGGPELRAIGKHLGDGEAIHQSAIDRIQMGECSYAPENLKSAMASSNIPVVTTTRISRGQACLPRRPDPAVTTPRCLVQEQ